LLVVAPVAETSGDAVGCGEEVRAEGVDELGERDHRGVGQEVESCNDLAGLVAYWYSDRVETGGELFVVDRELCVEYRVELLAYTSRCTIPSSEHAPLA
jgi:hypothetical protein